MIVYMPLAQYNRYSESIKLPYGTYFFYLRNMPWMNDQNLFTSGKNSLNFRRQLQWCNCKFKTYTTSFSVLIFPDFMKALM